MNERIRELAEQADIKFSAHWQHQGIDTAVIIPSDLKKFAELIVHECSGICRNVGEAIWTEQHQSNKGTALTCEAAIKKHFGVKE